MKLDMHCHTNEGSPDSKVCIKDYIEKLKSQGFDGMLITDHDSYGGYRYYIEHRNEMPGDFVVFKGIEYDTLDAGHFIVIMPDNIDLKVLECRGLRLEKLIELVHRFGGVLGPAHPCGEPFLSVFATGRFRRGKIFNKVVQQIDFMECFNCGEDPWDNERAVEIASEFGLPKTGGSDAHWGECVGLAYTLLSEQVSNNNELIDYIRSKKSTTIWGKPYNGTIKARLGKWNKLLVYGFFPYNKFEALRFAFRRRKAYRLDMNI